ncbi:MAG: hypothetical protein AAF438_20545 [Pseudomonadota bacterium]
MKKLLNNPWFVAGLALVAILFASRNLVFGIFADDDQPFDDEDSDAWEELDDATAGEQLIGIEHLSSVDVESVVWLYTPARDPFSPYQTFSPDSLPTSQDFSVVADQGIRPRLSALVVGERSSFAVLDGKIVRSGEFHGGYWIQQIHRNGVELLADGVSLSIRANE